LAVADAALGVSMIVVNAEKLNDLKNGNANTNPTFLGMDQDLLDKLGITLMVVNLALLAKHGLNKAADKLVNSKNSSALGDTWSAWKQQVQQDPAAASGKTGSKTAKSKPSRGALGGPGKNRPFDEFDDSHLYDEASKGRTSTINKVEPPPKTEGTGNTVFENGRASIETFKSNPKVFSGKSAEEIAKILEDAGYEVTVQASKKSRSGAKIIKIQNTGGDKNITQMQVSPGGGRHGESPYVKISTSDQGIIKIVDGSENVYKTDGAETATIIFTGRK
ncbi:hypothetical protein, partial [Paenibacillus taichungensis]|uniref:hypothetical protein n=1 Tax=Paenibacillus taichungensis TaxID=484184 RepID=UPI0039A2E90C